jgi:hypothetical protein
VATRTPLLSSDRVGRACVGGNPNHGPLTGLRIQAAVGGRLGCRRTRRVEAPVPSIVLDLLAVAEAPDNGSPWPPLPPDCPLAGARACNQHFYRFSDSSDPLDWSLPVVIWGAERAAHYPPERQCQEHAFSIFLTADALRRKRKRVKRFRDHKIVRFMLTPSMGVALEMPSGSSHYSWWPDVGFVPPPDDTELVE